MKVVSKKAKEVNLSKTPKKIKRSELDEIQGIIKQAHNLKLDIAEIELKKNSLMKFMDKINQDYAKVQSNLKEIYGEVDINIKDGTITPNKSESN